MNVSSLASSGANSGNQSQDTRFGTQSRVRRVLVPPQSGGVACPRLVEHRGCQVAYTECPNNNTDATKPQTALPCQPPQDCQVPSSWSAWTKCMFVDPIHKIGRKCRTRPIVKPTVGAGLPCPPTQQCEICFVARDCEMSGFTGWSECSPLKLNTTSSQPQVQHKLAIQGYQHRTRTVKIAPINGGATCPPTMEQRSCDLTAANCKLTQW